MNNNIAVVGCGYWGKNLVRNFFELGALAAVCDPDEQLARNYAKKYSVKKLSFAEIIHDPNIQGVVLAVPAVFHASMAIEAMDSGKHVFVEKPLAINMDEGEEMKAASARNGVELMVGHLLQYHPAFEGLLGLVSKDVLGPLRYIYSNRKSFGKVRSEEDVIWSFAPHDLSMILSLTCEDPVGIKTKSSTVLQPGIADISTIHLEFLSGIKAHVSVSWVHPFKEQKLVVLGEKSMAVFDDTKPWGQKLALYRHTIKSSEGIVDLRKADVEYVGVDEVEPLKRECQHFIDVVDKGRKPITNVSEGLRVLRVLHGASLAQKEKDR